jgi:hypothetical protein
VVGELVQELVLVLEMLARAMLVMGFVGEGLVTGVVLELLCPQSSE